ncbi:MAG: hypothetical protein ACLQAR_10885 [Steroidobacteraceae bacterium]
MVWIAAAAGMAAQAAADMDTGTVGTVGTAGAKASSAAIVLKAIAEVRMRVSFSGREATKLVPADRVVPGDEIFYTLEIRNTGSATVPAPSVVYPVPEHTRYVADSAIGPGAEVSFSIDGGRSFDEPEKLELAGSAGAPRPATAADYTHIRWQFKHGLKGKSVAFARFRAVVK